MERQESIPTAAGHHVAVLDGLRGIAIAWVLLFHLCWLSWQKPGLSILGWHVDLSFITQSGFLGVDLFFFVSGFCLFYPYARHMFEGRKLQTVGEFAYRRAIKILPSYYIALFLALAFAGPLFFPAQHAGFQVLTHLLFIYNFFPSTVNAVNGVFWSLAVEVQFYVLFPAICWLFRRTPLVTFAAMSAIAIAYRSWSFSCCGGAESPVHYQVPAFLDLFACGMLTAYVYGKTRAQPQAWQQKKGWMTGLSLLSLAAIGLSAYSFAIWSLQGNTGPNRPESTWVLGGLFAAFSLCTIFSVDLWRLVVANRILVFASIVSYNLYLYHLIIGMSLVYRLHFPSSRTRPPQMDPAWQIAFEVVAAAVAIAIAAALTYAVERPLLRDGLGAFAKIYAKLKALGRPAPESSEA